MGLRNWLRPKARYAKNHQITSSYSFLIGPTSAGRPVTERSTMQRTLIYRVILQEILGSQIYYECCGKVEGAEGGNEVSHHVLEGV